MEALRPFGWPPTIDGICYQDELSLYGVKPVIVRLDAKNVCVR